METPDESTVRVRLKEPFAPFLTAWATPGSSRAPLESVPDPNTVEFNTRSPIGTGPFKFREPRRGRPPSCSSRNPDYHGGPPYLERVIFKYIPDLTVLLHAVQDGRDRRDGAPGNLGGVLRGGERPARRHAPPPPLALVEYIYFNYGKPWFKERPVRQALYHATDKRAIIEQVYYGVPKPVEGYLPSTSWAYNADLPKHEYNPEKAKQILDEAGWRPGRTASAPRGACASASPTPRRRGTSSASRRSALQQNWRAVGVDMQISNMPAAVIWGEFYVKSKFDSLMVGIQASVGDDPTA